jgi:hypothetical protein
MRTDLTYFTTGPFVGFVANTPGGEDAWKELAKHSDGSGKFFACHLPAILAQLKAAGYSATKAKPVKAGEMDAILAELDALDGESLDGAKSYQQISGPAASARAV